MAKIHANNAAGLTRLLTLVSMHADAPRDIEPLISEAVDVIVHIARTEKSRVVTEITEVQDFNKSETRLLRGHQFAVSEWSSSNAEPPFGLMVFVMTVFPCDPQDFQL